MVWLSLLDCIYFTVSHPKEVYCHFHFSIFRVKNWDVDTSNWNNSCVLCWLWAGANETNKKNIKKKVESGTCISGFSLWFCLTKLNCLLQLYKCRIPLRLLSILIWIDLKINSKSDNGRQTPFLTDHIYVKNFEELGLFGIQEKYLTSEGML